MKLGLKEEEKKGLELPWLKGEMWRIRVVMWLTGGGQSRRGSPEQGDEKEAAENRGARQREKAAGGM